MCITFIVTNDTSQCNDKVGHSRHALTSTLRVLIFERIYANLYALVVAEYKYYIVAMIRTQQNVASPLGDYCYGKLCKDKNMYHT